MYRKIISSKYIKVIIRSKLANSVWLFPLILTFILLGLTSLKLNGSSMSIYHDFFYGLAEKDPALIAGSPREIRSDEWVVNTQISVAQSQNNFNILNPHLGEGINTSIIVDVPFDGFFSLFRPHNWSFFVLPFDYAFAMKWWIMGYLLILSVYFFVLALLPGKRLLASIIGLSMFFSPFIQWWYQYITLAPIYYSLFSLTLLILLTRTRSKSKKIFLATGLAYTLSSLALVQYPAFQIPCILVSASFAIGYIADLYRTKKHNIFKEYLSYCLVSSLVAICLTGFFLYQNIEPVQAVTNTTYPGAREIKSGGYKETHFFANHLAGFFQSDARASHYNIPDSKAVNQSESSNFIHLGHLLLIPMAYILIASYRQRRFISFTALAILSCLGIFWAWLVIPGLDILGSLLFLKLVPSSRLLIGMGLLNLMILVIFIQQYQASKTITKFSSIIYSLIVYLVLSLVALKIHVLFPQFIGVKWSLMISIPLAVTVYLLMQKHLIAGLTAFLVFSIASTVYIHPLYKGTDILTNNPLISEMQSITSGNKERWVIEDAYLQNFALMAGKPTLTGIYTYPQVKLWEDIEKNSDIYNRYAHVNFVIDRNKDEVIKTHLDQPIGDRFGVVTEACSSFINKNNVRYIVTSGEIDRYDMTCSQLVSTVKFPQLTVKIYRLGFHDGI